MSTLDDINRKKSVDWLEGAQHGARTSAEQIEQLRNALIWAASHPDFQPDGRMRQGFLEVVDPVLRATPKP